jgi:hypothetical protein
MNTPAYASGWTLAPAIQANAPPKAVIPRIAKKIGLGRTDSCTPLMLI